MKAAHPEVVAAARTNPGETLRQARESRNWSQADVAAKLNLTLNSLNHLETGAFDKLPGHTFARGYIRAYAKLLGMDQTPLVEAFDQFTGTNAKGSDVHGLGRIEEPVRLSHNILRIVCLLLLVLVIGGGFLWWQDQNGLRGKDQSGLAMEHVEVESADGTTQIHPIDEPEDQAVAEAGKNGSAPLSLEQGQAASGAASDAQPPAVAGAGTPNSSAPLPSTATPAAPALSTAPAATAPNAPAATAPAVQAPAETPAPAAVPAGNGQVQIQFTADCWTQVTDGTGKVLVSALKRQGDRIDVNGKPPFSVRLGFARGAQVTYNGQAVDVAPFTSGQTARVKLGQ